MRRRDFIKVVAGSGAAWPFTSYAQQLKSMRRIGVLINSTETDPLYQSYVAAFISGLRDLGWVDGKNVRVDIRWNRGDAERAQADATELVAMSPDVLVAASTTNLMALQRLTSSLPIVFVQVSDPVAQGIVASLTRPGGNITGFCVYEFSIGSKWVELLREVVPSLTRVAVMSNPDTSPQTKYFLHAIEAAASAYNVQVVKLPVRTSTEIEQAIGKIARQPGRGLSLPTDSFIRLNEKLIVEVAANNRVPTIFGTNGSMGGLIYYGPDVDLANQYRQAAGYVDRILKGAIPADLPIQLSTRYRLVVNTKAAKSLGIELPPLLLERADEIIEK